MPQKLIIDADPGIGDAVAIAIALFDPDVDVLAVTAAAGAVKGADATRNVQAIVEMLDPRKWPRLGSSSARAADSSIDYRATAVSTAELNGETGLGDCELQVAEMHNQHESAKLMVDLVKHDPNEIALITLGPLTNIELACDLDPEFLSNLRGLYSLGGSIEFGGDVTAVAELNIYADPEAARKVLRSPATKTLIPLDVSRKPILSFDQYQRLFDQCDSPLKEFLAQLLPFSLRAHRRHLGLEGTPLDALTALCAAVHPRLFETTSMAMDIETSGELTRGMTVFDRRGTQQWQTNIDVAIDVDAQGVLDYLARIVR